MFFIRLKTSSAKSPIVWAPRGPHISHRQIFGLARWKALYPFYWTPEQIFLLPVINDMQCLPDARTDFFIAHEKQYAVFAGSSEEDNNSSKLKRKEIICAWENTDFIIGQIKRITTIPGRERKAHSPFDWKISKTDHVRLAANVFVCNLDRANDTKLAKKLFLLKNIYYSWLSSVHPEYSTNSIRQMAFLSLITKDLL